MTRRLTAGVAIAAMLAAVLGLVVDGVYGDHAATTQMLRGYDLVTLFLVGPALLWSARAAAHDAVRGRLVTASLLAYLAYTYPYHLLGAGFTDLLLLHAPLLTAALVALVGTLGEIDRDDLPAHFGATVPVRIVGILLGTLGAALGLMWVYACAAFIVGGAVPAGSSLVETDTVVQLGIVLDLTLLVPLYVAAAVTLWRRTGWGFLLAAVALLAGTLHQVGYVVALLLQDAAEVPGAVALDPVEPVILLMYAVGTVLLLRPLGTGGGGGRESNPPDPDTGPLRF
jgi:hypothetical protein